MYAHLYNGSLAVHFLIRHRGALHAGTAQNTCAGHDDAVIADFYICFDIGKRLYGYVFTDFGGRVYIS